MGNENSAVRTVRVLLILLFAAGAISYYFLKGRPVTPAPGTPTASTTNVQTVKGKVGSEKLEFLRDPEVVSILHDKYHLAVDADKAGSIEMVQQPTAGLDFLWPSSQVAAEMYHGPKRAEDVIFRSPIVLYSWQKVTDSLIKRGIVQRVKDTYYIVDMPKLVASVNAGTSWSSMGLPDLNGGMTIRSTDPTSSNSGMMFAGLLATVGNHGDVITDAALPKQQATIVRFFGKLGFMEESSADLFRQYIETGIGQDPIIVGYESQLIEFGASSPDQAKAIADDVRILYPRPTVWCDHPLIALNDPGNALLEALRDDPDLRRIAWERHGFRIGPKSELASMKSLGIPSEVPSIVPAPRPEVMTRLLEALKK